MFTLNYFMDRYMHCKGIKLKIIYGTFISHFCTVLTARAFCLLEIVFLWICCMLTEFDAHPSRHQPVPSETASKSVCCFPLRKLNYLVFDLYST